MSQAIRRLHGWVFLVRGSRSQQTSYYGPSSAYCFLKSISEFLTNELQQPQPDHQLQPRAANKIFDGTDSLEDGEDQESDKAVSGQRS